MTASDVRFADVPSAGRLHSAREAPSGTSRLLRGLEGGSAGRRAGFSLEEHLAQWGTVTFPGRRSRDYPDAISRDAALTMLADSGMRGRGGAWFPTAIKWRAVATGRRKPIIVANCSESEPASAKDATLLSRVPHLVIDGAMYAAATLGASRVVFVVHEGRAAVMGAELARRAELGLNAVDAEVATTPGGYVSGEESAVVNYLNGGAPRTPTFTRVTPVFVKGIAGAPTLVQNAETFAHVALIARFGARWFRSKGTPDSPGTALVTVAGALATPRVVEIEVGSTLRQLIDRIGPPESPVQGVLTGGYGGAWLAAEDAWDVQLSPESLAGRGAAFGPGVFFLLSSSTCPVAQVAGLARWMAGQGAGQCGPCINGLPAIATGLESLQAGRAKRDTLDRVLQACTLVDGRGACAHPDGVAQMVRSGIAAFRSDFDAHARGKRCGRATGLLLPTRSIAAGGSTKDAEGGEMSAGARGNWSARGGIATREGRRVAP